MISTRKRPLLLSGMVLPTVAGHSRFAGAQQATPATPVPPSPPTQPAAGPGGAEYLYDEVIAQDLGKDPPSGVNPYDYWLFEPAGVPADTSLPVVFLVPWVWDEKPEYVRVWIEHLVRRGAVVIYPSGPMTMEFDQMTANVSAAVEELENGDHAPVDLDQIVVVGQGMGAATAARLVAEPPEGLPAPTALMAITPHTPAMRRPSTLPEHMAALPAETRVVLVGAEGMEASDRTDLDHAWAGLGLVGQVPIDRRAYVVLRSDDHGEPGLVADEWVSMAHPVFREMGVDALDWYGTWKLLDGLMACTFNGEFCEYAFGNTPEVRSMGTWSDGVPVTEALVITDVATPEATPAG